MLGLTIDQAILLVAVILFIGLVLGVFFGWREIRQATDLSYFLLRRERINRGWQLVGLGVVLGIGAGLVLLFGRRAAFSVIPPTPSATPTASTTPTPTMSLTPSITPTASITSTPSITPTPSATGIPSVPDGISVLFRETITPNPEAAFSAPVVARQIDDSVQPVNPSDSFEQPLGRLFGAFSYNNLEDGVRWTAIWYRGDEVICVETGSWDGGTGGFGFTECEPETPWLAGEYEIQLFVGLDWKTTARFTVVGDPPTSTPSLETTATPTP